MILHNNEISGKVIAITGASGYIGSALSEELKKYSNKVIRVSRKKLVPSKYYEDWILDLTRLESWMKITKKSDIVFHLSGNTSIYDAEQEPSKNMISTLLPVTHFVTASKILALKPLMVFASTATVYGALSKIPISENDIPEPITNYDMHKFLAEQILITAHKNEIIDTKILRLANVYGPSLIEVKSSDRGILSKLTRMALEGKNLNVYGDGEYLRDYIYIKDVVAAFLSVTLVESNESVFNVSSGVGTKVKDVFELIASEVNKISKLKIKVRHVEWPNNVSEIEKRNFVGSNNLLKSNTYWNPNIEIQEGIKTLVEFYAQEYY